MEVNVTRDDPTSSVLCRLPFHSGDGLARANDDLTFDMIMLFIYGRLVLFGFIGNSLTIIVMHTKKLRKQSYSIYCSVLALFDSLTLCERFLSLLSMLYRRITGSKEPLVNLNSDAACRTVELLGDFFFGTASFCVVAMTAERLIITRFPFAARRICTRKKAMKIVQAESL